MRPFATPSVVARDVSYHTRGYRSFEFVSFEAFPGSAHALLASEHEPARDALLAVAGLVRPTDGMLTVANVELTQPVASGPLAVVRRVLGPRERMPRRTVGLGVFERVAPVDEQLTVEEAVEHEVSVRGGQPDPFGQRFCPDERIPSSKRGDASSPDLQEAPSAEQREAPGVLPYLAALGLATVAEQQISRLDPALRARLSVALACAGTPAVAVVDLTDPFVAGLAADDAAALMADARAVARVKGVAVLVATTELACARASQDATALDMPAAEALAAAAPQAQEDGAAPTMADAQEVMAS